MRIALAFTFAVLLFLRPAAASEGGYHDFDFEIGTWNIRVRELARPLSGSQRWLQPRGYVHVAQPIWGGHAILAQLEVEGTPPRFLGSLIHLYDSAAHVWKIYWADSSDGTVDPPLRGGFRGGIGTFAGRQRFAGKPVLVRVVYSRITPASFHSEQAISSDGGKTWRTNLIQDFSRIK